MPSEGNTWLRKPSAKSALDRRRLPWPPIAKPVVTTPVLATAICTLNVTPGGLGAAVEDAAALLPHSSPKVKSSPGQDPESAGVAIQSVMLKGPPAAATPSVACHPARPESGGGKTGESSKGGFEFVVVSRGYI